ncbi:MAG0110 family membrane protein [Mycoplasma sp. 'Moose RK']|uniref:MAG0110 family membrane protein n=1 Tax=Mycoplasma sp. 'Moose RK' TaxID=2780095 RepID=UPI0018C1EF18|nr:Bax inhibitor-1 family protein [Mycoplasma sp. 'Moose RK']MBG0730560.1 US12 family protein [Mycoplasma sp. 'Moose RK']
MQNRIVYNSKDSKAYSRSTFYIQKQTNKLLAYSMIWLGLGILFIGLVTFGILSSDTLFSLYLKFIRASFSSVAAIIISLFVLVGINWGISAYISKRALTESPPTVVLALLFLVFISANSLFLPIIFTAQYLVDGSFNYIMIAFAGAGGLMSMIAILGYFNIINFGKLLPVIAIGFLIEIVIAITSYFVFSSILTTFYIIIGLSVTLGMVGYQFWLIKNQTCQILAFYNDEAEIKRVFLRIAIWNALTLYLSLVRLFLFLLRLLNFTRS